MWPLRQNGLLTRQRPSRYARRRDFWNNKNGHTYLQPNVRAQHELKKGWGRLKAVIKDVGGYETHLRLCVKANPGHVRGHYTLALYAKEKKETTDEQNHLQNACDAEIPADDANAEDFRRLQAKAHYTLARIARSVHKDTASQTRHLHECVKVDPSHALAQQELRVMWREEQKLRIAATQNGADATSAHYGLAEFAWARGDRKKQKQHLEAVIEREPKHADAHYDLACLLRGTEKSRDFARAREARQGRTRHLEQAVGCVKEQLTGNAHYERAMRAREEQAVQALRPAPDAPAEDALTPAAPGDDDPTPAEAEEPEIPLLDRLIATEEQELRLAIEAHPRHGAAHYMLSKFLLERRHDRAGQEEHLRLALDSEDQFSHSTKNKTATWHADAHHELSLRRQTEGSTIRGKIGSKWDSRDGVKMGTSLQLVDVIYPCSEG
jgi:hypothetical protein